MHRTGKAIRAIKEATDSTSKIIKSIDAIAFQTNLLALNAAVAEEVRNLAQRGY
jgi:methyl-accepting chemotaxis protein